MRFVLLCVPSQENRRLLPKTIFITRFASVILLAACLHAPSGVHAQSISLDLKKASLEYTFRKIEEQTNFSFVYGKEQLIGSQPVNIKISNAAVKEVLDLVFKNQQLTYIINGKYIALREKPQKLSPAIVEDITIDISGKVLDEHESPLVNASVKVKGSNKGTSTNAHGQFNLKGLAEDAVLEASYVGFESQEIAVGKKHDIVIHLKGASPSLDQFVVIGYGSVRKKDVTGAVGTVDMEDLQKAPVISFEQALTGRVAGVKASSADGQPGAPINVTIRGANSVTQDNSPLYVIDGFPLENPDNNALNPAEIASIEVLKDASATAIYGARGANGVIIITTKKGKIGEPIISYNGYYGFMNNNKRMKMMDGYNFVKYQMELDSANANAVYLADGKTLEDYRNSHSESLQDKVFRTSPFQNHFISLTGGTDKTTYAISGSVLKQEGIIKNSGYDRYQGRVNLDQKVGENFKVGINTNYSALRKYGMSPSQGQTGYFHGNLLYAILAYRPVTATVIEVPIEEQDDDFVATGNFNPVKTVENEHRQTSTDVLSTNAYGEYSFGKYLKLRVTGGMTKFKARQEQFNGSQTRSGSPLTLTGQNTGVNGSVDYDERVDFLNENTLTYNRTFSGDHSVNVMTGFTAQKTTFSSFGARALQIPNEALGLSGIDEGTPQVIRSSRSSFSLASFLGRVNYSFRSKYLLTASLRADGSSKFAPENRWSYFPSGAVAWRIDQEAFMKSMRFLSEAKLRLTYGTTGNNRISDFAYLSRVNLPPTIGYSYNNARFNVARVTDLGNPDLKWETTSQFNIGFDLGLFNQRVTFTADVYRKITYDLLLNAKLPTSLGFTDAFKNIGKIQNQGLELTLNTVNFDSKNITWSTNFNISFNQNKVLALAENQTALYTVADWTVDTRNVPLYVAGIGQPVALFYGYIWEGNYQYAHFDKNANGIYVLKSDIATYDEDRSKTQPGDIKYKDVTGDGIVNNDDRTIIGNPNPKFIGGFNNDLKYKNFDLNVFVEFSYGNQVMNANRIVFEGDNRVNGNMFATYINRWTPENQNNKYYATGGSGPIDGGYSTRVVEDASYLRLKTVSLGYNVKPALLKRVKLKTMRVYVSAQNLLTFTGYEGFDPEVSVFGNSALRPAFDYSVYPLSRTITFGLNLSL